MDLYKVTQMKLNLEKVLKLKLTESPNDDLCQKLAPSLFTDHLFGWGLFLKTCLYQLQQERCCGHKNNINPLQSSTLISSSVV